MQRPYSILDMADHAGRGNHATPPDATDHQCPGCGATLPPGRSFCPEHRCRALWVRRGKGKPSDEPLPLIEQYSA